MTNIETLQLAGFVLVAASLLILAGTAATILYRRRVDEMTEWVAEQDQAAREDAGRRTMPPRAVVPPRPVSIDNDTTRPLQAPEPIEPVVQVGPADYVLQVGPCGNGHDHPAHYFIEYIETLDPACPDMKRRPCPGVRSGPHRRRV